jgi:hypothetical protein
MRPVHAKNEGEGEEDPEAGGVFNYPSKDHSSHRQPGSREFMIRVSAA